MYIYLDVFIVKSVWCHDSCDRTPPCKHYVKPMAL